ncbi:DUF6684 family protein [Haloprofundus halophilus]|uniref:DUF6684 family protein n=1 Tax=Haloprofundus halophilus TaxID=2283527 RepID=UPI001E566F2A|nr:DUF6684 family protein [Haloprofundus halophilus]
MANTNSNKVFDRETLLDLTVNIIPLFILLFFVVLFLLVQPWGGDLFPTAIMVGLHAVPFVLLAILTYFSGKAVASAEKSSTVYYPGQAGMPGAEAEHGETNQDGRADTQAIESGTDRDSELTAGDETDDDTTGETDDDTLSETDDDTTGETDNDTTGETDNDTTGETDNDTADEADDTTADEANVGESESDESDTTDRQRTE